MMQRQTQPLTGILLNGGKSKRMGSSKAELLWHGRMFLEVQAEKLRAAGALLRAGQQSVRNLEARGSIPLWSTKNKAADFDRKSAAFLCKSQGFAVGMILSARKR